MNFRIAGVFTVFSSGLLFIHGAVTVFSPIFLSLVYPNSNPTGQLTVELVSYRVSVGASVPNV